MFFYLSKLLWLVAAPGNLLLMISALGVVLLFTRFWRWGRGLALAGVMGFVMAGSGPAAMLMIRVLEQRFAQPAADMPAPDGIIVLGGAVNELMMARHGQVALSEGAERMTEGAALLRRYPRARLVFTGGSNALFGSPYKESDVARRLWRELGADESRILYEENSRNTFENAVMTRDLVQPKAGERWLLVTSAYHMPRSAGIFRKAGFDVVPYPVDYRVMGDRRDFRPVHEFSRGMHLFDMAAREWIGLAAYYMSGRTDALLPGPAAVR